MDKIKIGVIGCGYWGPNLIRNFNELNDSDVVAVADLKDSRLKSIQNTYPNIKATKNFHDFFEDGIEAAVIATPPATHYAVARDCLEHGLHVLIEKPLTLRSDDGQKLVDLAESKSLTLMVGHTYEYNTSVHALKEIIKTGTLGDIYYLDLARLNLGLFQKGLNVVWDLAPHDISILLFLLDMYPISVSTQGNPCVFENIFDVAYLHLMFPNRISAYVHVSWLDPCKVRRVTVVGSKRMVVYNDLASVEKIKIFDKGVDPPQYTETFGEFIYNYRYGDITIPNVRFVEPLKPECQHFIDCIFNHTEPRSSGKDGLIVVKILEAAERSMNNGSKQEVVLW